MPTIFANAMRQAHATTIGALYKVASFERVVGTTAITAAFRDFSFWKRCHVRFSCEHYFAVLRRTQRPERGIYQLLACKAHSHTKKDLFPQATLDYTSARQVCQGFLQQPDQECEWVPIDTIDEIRPKTARQCGRKDGCVGFVEVVVRSPFIPQNISSRDAHSRDEGVCIVAVTFVGIP